MCWNLRPPGEQSDAPLQNAQDRRMYAGDLANANLIYRVYVRDCLLLMQLSLWKVYRSHLLSHILHSDCIMYVQSLSFYVALIKSIT
jgi:hypothetical protein